MIPALQEKLHRQQWCQLKTILYESCDVLRHRQVYEWIDQKWCEEGHCILGYLRARAQLKDGRLMTPGEFEVQLSEAIFFLLRVAEDCVAARQVNGFTKQTDLFTIFHAKIRKWLVPFESRVGAPPDDGSSRWLQSLLKAPAPKEWPGVGEVFNAWPTVGKIVANLRALCQARPVATHVKSHWAWCQFASLEWIDTIHFGDMPLEIIGTYETNLAAAQRWRQAARESLLEMIETCESWESFWSLSPGSWVRLPSESSRGQAQAPQEKKK